MSRVYERDINGKERTGYAGEGTCPVCGCPVPAIFWDDGTCELEVCYYCSKKRLDNVISLDRRKV